MRIDCSLISNHFVSQVQSASIANICCLVWMYSKCFPHYVYGGKVTAITSTIISQMPTYFSKDLRIFYILVVHSTQLFNIQNELIMILFLSVIGQINTSIQSFSTPETHCYVAHSSRLTRFHLNEG